MSQTFQEPNPEVPFPDHAYVVGKYDGCYLQTEQSLPRVYKPFLGQEISGDGQTPSWDPQANSYQRVFCHVFNGYWGEGSEVQLPEYLTSSTGRIFKWDSVASVYGLIPILNADIPQSHFANLEVQQTSMRRMSQGGAVFDVTPESEHIPSVECLTCQQFGIACRSGSVNDSENGTARLSVNDGYIQFQISKCGPCTRRAGTDYFCLFPLAFPFASQDAIPEEKHPSSLEGESRNQDPFRHSLKESGKHGFVRTSCQTCRDSKQKCEPSPEGDSACLRDQAAKAAGL
ncbi:hypothetical protein TREMEDRAFT_65686 [Tremella mesenterica DSM 1558]|uniref:uncharacterized protein n=1 Tax=Tremella mesenterica (strain ATCC 24925 / CBS 8224 / DSM 1558 / NBRC 9311 / NRRL Y-6157 / RJB 2259-6 / UBC 559-6) TaxID=578456 RepID=UPI00032C9C4F|nr:uncharacterized protein TREMEDRAFT_65686 [Tremella mesenterica DSM 1558]EIW66399.1 hypothetical protein TREMEDRAFT_65686 [Tremella mesenterica DSM 1558]